MAWQDRPYYQDRPESGTNPLMWLLTGSVPLFTVFGIRVRAHAWLVGYVVYVLLFGLGQGFTWLDRVQSMTILFVSVLLHEFGHCFTARWVGGQANEILMHPLGGLALAEPPRRPLPTFLTILGGPAVTFLICVLCGTLLWFIGGWLPWNPFRFTPIGKFNSWVNIYYWAMWVYQVNLMLLAFNLLPIYPLDGGQMLQATLWPWFGYYKAMLFSCTTGMVGAVLGAMVALARGNIGLAILAIMGFMTCLQLRRQLVAAGPHEFEDDNIDYSAAYEPATPRKRRFSGWSAKRARKRAMKQANEDRLEQHKIDNILAKVSAHGMQSLSWLEKRALKKATERQRQRQRETSRRV